MLLKQIKWAIIRFVLKFVHCWDEKIISQHLVMKQFKKYPKRWEKYCTGGLFGKNKVCTYKPSSEEKERWFDEKMLRRRRDNGIESVAG